MVTYNELFNDYFEKKKKHKEFGKIFLNKCGGLESKLAQNILSLRINLDDFLNEVIQKSFNISSELQSIPTKEQIIKELQRFENQPELILQPEYHKYISPEIHFNFITHLQEQKLNFEESSPMTKEEIESFGEREVVDLPKLDIDDIARIRKQISKLINYYDVLIKHKKEFWAFNPRVYFHTNIIIPYFIFDQIDTNPQSTFLKLSMYKIIQGNSDIFFNKGKSKLINTILDQVVENIFDDYDPEITSSSIRNNLRDKLKEYDHANKAFNLLDQLSMKAKIPLHFPELIEKVLPQIENTLPPKVFLNITNHLTSWYHRNKLLPLRLHFSQF